jgi:hypothetical protein
MSTHTRQTVRLARIGAALAVLLLTTPSATAANRGDPFLLGEENTIDLTTTLKGTTSSGPQFQVTNVGGLGAGFTGANGLKGTATATNGSGVHGVANTGLYASGISGESASGAGVYGFSSGGTGQGVAGYSAAAGGTGVIGQAFNGSGARGVYGNSNGGTGVYGTAASGVGVRGVSSTGTGVYARGGVFGGVFGSDTGIGLQSASSKDDGIRAASTAANKSGLWAHHDGSNWGYGLAARSANGVAVTADAATDDGLRASTSAKYKSGVWAHHDGSSFGYGLFAQSAVGPAIGMNGPDAGQPPITLNGNPFPSAKVGDKDADGVIPNDNYYHTIASMSLGPGAYAIIARANLGNAAGTGWSFLKCGLHSGSDGDSVETWVQGSATESVPFLLFSTLTSAGSVDLNCAAADWEHSGSFQDIRILAIRVGGGTTTKIG